MGLCTLDMVAAAGHGRPVTCQDHTVADQAKVLVQPVRLMRVILSLHPSRPFHFLVLRDGRR